MKITGLDHITVNVKDLEASKKFYQEILGLKESGFLDMGDHTLTYFELPHGIRLELIDYVEKCCGEEIRETQTGTYRHFCLVTDNLKALYETCKKNNVFCRKAPSYVEKLGCETMLITDVNGVEIEIIQR